MRSIAIYQLAFKAALAAGLVALSMSALVIRSGVVEAQSDDTELELVGSWQVDPAGGASFVEAEHVIASFGNGPSISVSGGTASLFANVLLTTRRETCLSQTEFAFSAVQEVPPTFDPAVEAEVDLAGTLRVVPGRFDTCGEPVTSIEPASDLAVTVQFADQGATVSSAVASGVDYAPNFGEFRPAGEVVTSADEFFGFWAPDPAFEQGTLFDGSTADDYQWFSSSVDGDQFTASSVLNVAAQQAGCESQTSLGLQLAGTVAPSPDEGSREILLAGIVSVEAGEQDTCDTAFDESWLWGTATLDGDTIQITSLPVSGADYAPHVGPLMQIDVPSDAAQPLLIAVDSDPLDGGEDSPADSPADSVEAASDDLGEVPPTENDDAAAADTSTPATASSSSSTALANVWRALSILATVLSVVMIGIALRMARKESRIRPILEVIRLVVMVGVAVVMVVVFSSTVSPAIVGAAAVVGLTLGYFQGKNLEVRVGDRGVVARRNMVGVVVFAVGLIVVQIASLAQRSGLITLGVALSALSAAVLMGTIIGRRRPTAMATAQLSLLVVVLIGLSSSPTSDTAFAQEASYDGLYEGVGRTISEDIVDSDGEVGFFGFLAAEVGIPSQALAVSETSVYLELLFESTLTFEDCTTTFRALLAASGQLDPEIVDTQSVALIGTTSLLDVSDTCGGGVESTSGLIIVQVDLTSSAAQVTSISIANDGDASQLVDLLIAGFSMEKTSSEAPDIAAQIAQIPFPGEEVQSGESNEADVEEQEVEAGTEVADSGTPDEDLVDLFVDDDATGQERDAALAAIAAMFGAVGLGAVTLLEAGSTAARGGAAATVIDEYGDELRQGEDGLYEWDDGDSARRVDRAELEELLGAARGAQVAQAADEVQRLAEQDRFREESWETLRDRVRIETAVEMSAIELETYERQELFDRGIRLRDSLETAVDGPLRENMLDFLERNPAPTDGQFADLRNIMRQQDSDQRVIDSLDQRSEVAMALEGIQSDVARLAEMAGRPEIAWVIRNPSVPARMGVAYATGGMSEVALAPIDLWLALDGKADAVMAAENRDLTTPEIVSEVAWAVAVEFIGARLGGAGAEIPPAPRRPMQLLPENYMGQVKPGQRIPLLHQTGYTPDHLSRLTRFAEENGVIPGTRTANQYSAAHIRAGTAVPKPLDVKPKSINEIDLRLGARADHLGTVGFFEPKMPDTSKMSAELREQVGERFAKRMAEQTEYLDEILANPNLRIEAGRIFDVKTGKAFAGDMDLVYLRDAKTGEVITGQRYRDLRDSMIGEGLIEHGAEFNIHADLTEGLTPKTPEYKAAFAKADYVSQNILMPTHDDGALIMEIQNGVAVRGEDILMLPINPN